MKRLAFLALLLVGCAGDVKAKLGDTYAPLFPPGAVAVRCWYNSLAADFSACVVTTPVQTTGFACFRSIGDWHCEPMTGATFAPLAKEAK